MEIIKRFEAEYQRYNGLSESRVRRQRSELAAFIKATGKDLDECDANDLRAYLAALVDEDLHPNTVRFRGNLIRPFFTWAWEVGIIDAESYLRIKAVANPDGSSPSGDPRPYTPKELRQFWIDLDARWPHIDPKWWKYWRQGRSRYRRIASSVMRWQIEAVVALALDCGLRRGEIFGAEIDHIHYDNAYVIVPQRGTKRTGKDKFREVPITADARSALRNWFEMRAELKPKHDRPWISASQFNNQPKGWLDPMNERRWRMLLLTIGDYQMHRFRHTCATLWLRSGMPIEQVQKLLGHANLQQTLRYAQIINADVQKQVELNEGRFAQMTGRRTAGMNNDAKVVTG